MLRCLQTDALHCSEKPVQRQMEIDNRDCYWASFVANMSHDPNLNNDYHPPTKDSNCLPLVLLPLSGILCVLLDYMDKGNFWNVLKQSGRNKKKKREACVCCVCLGWKTIYFSST